MRRETSSRASSGALPAVIGGRYNLVGRVSRGLITEVWWAWDREARAERVLKLLPPSADKVRRFRFFEEMGRLRAVDHPGVVRVYDVGEQSGWCYAVLENVIGGSLATRSRRDGPLLGGEVVRVGMEVLDALHAVHGSGVVHGAVSLDHVLLDARNHVRLVDFGAAASGISPDVDVEATAALLLTLLIGRPPRLPQDLDHPDVPDALRPALRILSGEAGTTPSARAARRALADAMPPTSTPSPADDRDAPGRPTGLMIAGLLGWTAVLAWALWMAG